MSDTPKTVAPLHIRRFPLSVKQLLKARAARKGITLRRLVIDALSTLAKGDDR